MQELMTDNRRINKYIKIFAATFVLGFMAHGFAFCNLFYSHDSLMIYTDDAGWEISLGRFMEPVYLLFRKQINAPFLIGCLSLCFLASTVCVLVKLFDIKNMVLIVLLAGILVANDTMICLIATFCTWEDMYTLALLLAVMALYAVTVKPSKNEFEAEDSVLYRLKRTKGWKATALQILLAGMLIATSMGLYQSYVSVYVTLSMIYAIWLLMNETKLKDVFSTVGLQIAGAGAGAVLYVIGMQLMVKVTHIPLADTYNGISSVGDFSGISLPELLRDTYIYFAKDYFKTTQQISIAVINAILFAGVIIYIFFRAKLKTCYKLLTLCVMLLIPFGANLIYFISKGYVHELMLFSFDMVYIIPMLCLMKCGRLSGACKAFDIQLSDSACNENGKNSSADAYAANSDKRYKSAAMLAKLMLTVIIMCNIVLANQVYLKKKLVYDSTQAVMNRILYSIETLDEYEPGITPVLMSGSLQCNEYCSNIDHFDMAESVSYVDPDVSVTYGATYKLWFKYVLNADVEFALGEAASETAASEEVKSMPAFPRNGYVKMIDGIAVVKLSE